MPERFLGEASVQNPPSRDVSILGHCSRAGYYFQVCELVENARSAPPPAVVRRTMRDKFADMKNAPPCETMDHPRPFRVTMIPLQTARSSRGDRQRRARHHARGAAIDDLHRPRGAEQF